MSWPLREVADANEFDRVLSADGPKGTIGLYWRSEHIGQDGGRTPGVVVVLPPGGYAGLFMPHHDYDGHRWSVSGEWPNVTITPSINCVGSYHGWIQNGVITDDCEGRTF